MHIGIMPERRSFYMIVPVSRKFVAYSCEGPRFTDFEGL